MKMTMEQASEINRRVDGKCPIHISKPNPNCSICAKVGEMIHESRVEPPSFYRGVLKDSKPAKRIRQSEPKIRPWEQEWADKLKSSGEWMHVKAQSFRVRLANGAWYKPDVSAVSALAAQDEQQIYCWEIKGGKKMKGVAKGILALKVAASQYPEIVWTLCYKEKGEWMQQIVDP